MTPELVGLALGGVGIEPQHLNDGGTFIVFSASRLVDVMRAIGGVGDHLVGAETFVDDFGEGPEISIDMPAVPWLVAHEAYLAAGEQRVATSDDFFDSILAEADAQPAPEFDEEDLLASLGITPEGDLVPPPSPPPRSRFARAEVV